MKQFMILFASFCILQQVNGQSDKFQRAMETNVLALDTIRTSDGLLALSNTFTRIAEAEKTQWLPYYYASLSQVLAGLMTGSEGRSGNGDITDPMADKAEEMILKAEQLMKDNSEIFVVKKMIATLRMMADPMNRWQTYGPVAAEALATAKKLDPENPRVYLLEGQDKLFTPAEFGGSKEDAAKLFAQALQKFEQQKPASSIHPQWGLKQVKYFQSQVN